MEIKNRVRGAVLNQPVKELTTGQLFQSHKEAKASLGISAVTLLNALRSGKPITRGRYKGFVFVPGEKS